MYSSSVLCASTAQLRLREASGGARQGQAAAAHLGMVLGSDSCCACLQEHEDHYKVLLAASVVRLQNHRHSLVWRKCRPKLASCVIAAEAEAVTSAFWELSSACSSSSCALSSASLMTVDQLCKALGRFISMLANACWKQDR